MAGAWWCATHGRYGHRNRRSGVGKRPSAREDGTIRSGGAAAVAVARSSSARAGSEHAVRRSPLEVERAERAGSSAGRYGSVQRSRRRAGMSSWAKSAAGKRLIRGKLVGWEVRHTLGAGDRQVATKEVLLGMEKQCVINMSRRMAPPPHLRP